MDPGPGPGSSGKSRPCSHPQLSHLPSETGPQQWFSQGIRHQNQPQDLSKHRELAPPPGVRRSPQICISNRLPGRADTVGLGAHLGNHGSRTSLSVTLQGPWQIPWAPIQTLKTLSSFIHPPAVDSSIHILTQQIHILETPLVQEALVRGPKVSQRDSRGNKCGYNIASLQACTRYRG